MITIIFLNGWWCVNPEPVSRNPGRDGDPARRWVGPGDRLDGGSGEWRLLPCGPDWMDDEQWEACLASRAGEQEPDDPDWCQDPDSAPPPGLDEAELAALIAGPRPQAGPGIRARVGRRPGVAQPAVRAESPP